MTPAIQAWKDKWKFMHQVEVEELRATPVDDKLQQIAALMASVDAYGWRESLEADDKAGYDRWQQLRQAYARRTSQRP